MTRYCAHCGHALVDKPPTQCTQCQAWTFVVIKPSSSAVILNGDRFLAVRRARPPFAGMWDVPGGKCEAFEHPTDTAVREVLEETGLKVDLGPLIGLYIGDYAYQGDVHPTLNAYYLARLTDPDDLPQRITDETTDAEWLSLSNPPVLAFEHQQKMIQDAAVAASRWTAAAR